MATTFTQITEQDDVSFQVMNDLTDEIATAIDNALNLSLGANNQLLGIKAASLDAEWKTLSGTANEITVTHAANSITLALVTPLGVAKGGSGLSSYAIGDLLYASAATTLAKLADVATGSYLASGGVGVAPAWATLNQAAVAGLTTASSPTFTGSTLSGMSIAGYVKNDANGVLSGGNSVSTINSIQRGIGTFDGSGGTSGVTITAVVLAKSFITFTSLSAVAGGQTMKARLTTTTNLEIVRPAIASADREYAWEVIEFA